MGKRKIYVVLDDYQYINWMGGVAVDTIEEADLVCFTGGSDIDPSLYGKRPHPTTSSLPARDMYEVSVFNRAVELQKPIIGICRGHQLAGVMSGYQLVQHSHHPFVHNIETSCGKILKTNSLHHQRVFIEAGSDAEVLAWAIGQSGKPKLSPYNFGEDNSEDMSGEKEVEAAYFGFSHALGIQGHPELLTGESKWQRDFISYCRELIVKHLNV